MKILSILETREKKKFFIFLLLILLTALVELLGIGLILPFTSMIVNENSNFFSFFLKFNFFEILDKNTLKYFFCLFLLSVFLLKNLYLGFFYYYEGIFLNSTIHNISTRIFKKILDNKLKSSKEFHSSEILNDLTKEIQMFGNYLSSFSILVTEIPIIIGISLLIFIFQTKLVLIVLSIILLTSLIYFFSANKKIKNLGKSRKINEQNKLKYLQEGLSGIKEIQLYGKEDFFKEKFREKSANIAKTFSSFHILVRLPRLFFEFLFVIIATVLITYFTYFNIQPSEYIPFLALFMIASFRILPGVNRILNAYAQISYTKNAFQTICNKVNFNKIYKKAPRKLLTIENNISIRGVSFNYTGKEPVIININENIKKGDSVAIFGPSGVGKSTLLDLITGIKEPTKGNIFYDNKRHSVFENTLLKNISYVPQSIYLFDDTIKNNITFYTTNFDSKKFQTAIKIAKLESFINQLPYKEETIIGEIGKKISGGEKQRIGLARAIYHNPDILILDEVTSAVDSDTENEIFKSLSNFVKQDKILIYVSHKKSLLKFSNKIIRLKN